MSETKWVITFGDPPDPLTGEEAWVLSDKLRTTGALLRRDRAAAEACSRFAEAGVGVILLKGPSFAAWLYPDARDRYYGDVDLLAPPGADPDTILRSLGYEMTSSHPLGVHTTWTHPQDGQTIELHTTLLGIEGSPTDTWHVLATRTEQLQLAGTAITILDEPARAVHAALHAASHGAHTLAAEDLRRACRVGAEVWRQALALAYELEAVNAFSAGLWVIPEGRALAESLGVPRNTSTSIELRSLAAPNAAQVLAMMEEARGFQAKRSILGPLFRPRTEPAHDRGSTSKEHGIGFLVFAGRVARLIFEVRRGSLVWWRVRRDLRRRRG